MQFTISTLALLLATSASALPAASSIPERRQAGTVGVGGACDFGDCLPGLSCRGFSIDEPKTCTRNNGAGAFCVVDDDCHSGVCGLGDNGSQGVTAFQCLTSRPALERRQAGTVDVGGACEFGDCLPGLSCRGFSIDEPKTCTRNNGPGTFCVQNDDCNSGICGVGDNGSQGATLLQCLTPRR